MSICQYCHKELVNANAYEDGLYSIIGAWLCEVTCIEWYRFHTNMKLPVGKQIGMIFIKDYYSKYQSSSTRQVGADIDTASFCLAVEETEMMTVDLHVIQEQGEPVRCDQTLASVWTRSASDVIKQINSLVISNDFNKSLKNNEIVISKTNKVDVSLNERNEVWEYWAEASFPVTSCRKTSYPLDGDELVYCVELCDGTPICRAKEHPDCIT